MTTHLTCIFLMAKVIFPFGKQKAFLKQFIGNVGLCQEQNVKNIFKYGKIEHFLRGCPKKKNK